MSNDETLGISPEKLEHIFQNDVFEIKTVMSVTVNNDLILQHENGYKKLYKALDQEYSSFTSRIMEGAVVNKQIFFTQNKEHLQTFLLQEISAISTEQGLTINDVNIELL
jgi:hypothetical protein